MSGRDDGVGEVYVNDEQVETEDERQRRRISKVRYRGKENMMNGTKNITLVGNSYDKARDRKGGE